MTLSAPYYDDGGVTIHHGDSLEVLRQLPDGIVQTCVTSPPYWGLRTYGVEGQLGLEPTPEAFIANMVELFAEVRRVLRDDGTLWLNLGDSYAGGGVNASSGSAMNLSAHIGGRTNHAGKCRMDNPVPAGLKPKDLCGMPWRVALALQADGWYLRSDIIWAKPNPMPESCTDRPTKSHEHIFLMSKKPHYYYDADAVREDFEPSTVSRNLYVQRNTVPVSSYPGVREFTGNMAKAVPQSEKVNPAGRNKRDVWTVATESFKGAHFATYPRKLIEPCILAGANDRACAKCGKAWRRVVERTRMVIDRSERTHPMGQTRASGTMVEPATSKTVGHEPDCKCGTTDTVPSIVLDPFMGSGTTAEVARKHGCRAIGIELNAEYIDLAAKRLQQGVLEF